MLTQPPNHSCTFPLQAQPLTEDNRTHCQAERPTLCPNEKALKNRHSILSVRTLTGMVYYLDEILKCQGQQVIHMPNVLEEMIQNSSCKNRTQKNYLFPHTGPLKEFMNKLKQYFLTISVLQIHMK